MMTTMNELLEQAHTIRRNREIQRRIEAQQAEDLKRATEAGLWTCLRQHLPEELVQLAEVVCQDSLGANVRLHLDQLQMGDIIMHLVCNASNTTWRLGKVYKHYTYLAHTEYELDYEAPEPVAPCESKGAETLVEALALALEAWPSRQEALAEEAADDKAGIAQMVPWLDYEDD